MKLNDVITIDEKFQTAINLKLDLEHYEKIAEYIPTTSSREVLKRYLTAVFEKKSGKSSMLYAAYGRGKSHVILVLLGILQSYENKNGKLAVDKVIKNIHQVDKDFGLQLKQWVSLKRKYLPVIISFGKESSLEQSYTLALNDALQRNQLTDLIPDSYYREAVKNIKNWKNNYTMVYVLFKKELETYKMTVNELIRKLRNYDKKSLELFKAIYPKMTAGNQFNPLISMDIVDNYKDIAQTIKQYGYEGIIIVFDEFGKFVDASKKDTASKDMDLVQSMCELCENKETEIRQIFIGHKPIKEYARDTSKEVFDLLQSIEKRMLQMEFVENYKSPYELICNVIHKNKHWNAFLKDHAVDSNKIAEESYKVADFYTNFEKNEFEKIVVKGCFPMMPITAYILLKISAYAGQNERTIFTFLAGNEEKTLRNYVEYSNENQVFAGADLIYDYFGEDFAHDRSNEKIHNEYLKANYILQKKLNNLLVQEQQVQEQNDETEEIIKNERKIVKTIALFAMLGNDVLPANAKNLSMASGISEDEFQDGIRRLGEKGILTKRKRTGIYVFRQELNVNIENEIQNTLHNDISVNESEVVRMLGELFERKYELPKQYNQNKAMVRYFSYDFLSETIIGAINNVSVLYNNQGKKGENSEKFSDGKILLVYSEKTNRNKVFAQKVKKKIVQLHDERILFLLPVKKSCLQELVMKYMAVLKLKDNEEFLLENEMALEELLFYQDELKEEINQEIMDTYFPYENTLNQGIETIGSRYCKKEKNVINFAISTRKNMCTLLSEICEDVYGMTPRINHELINRRNISAQIKKARNEIITALFSHDEKMIDSWRDGNSANATIFRAVFESKGLLQKENSVVVDEETKEILMLITDFVESAAGKRVSFGQLYRTLQGTEKNIGIRKGVIPLYLSYVLSSYMTQEENSGVPVVYVNNVEQSVSADILNMVDVEPSEYSLYMEKDTESKHQYINKLYHLFVNNRQERKDEPIDNMVLSENGTMVFKILVDGMREWYQALQNYSKLTLSVGSDVKRKFRKSLAIADINPREYLFEELIGIFSEEETEDFLLCYDKIEKTKNEIDHVFAKLQQDVKEYILQELSFGEVVNLGKDEFREKYCGWCEKISYSAKNQLFSRKATEFLKIARKFKNSTEEVILNQLSYSLLGVYLGELTDETVDHLKKHISDIVKEINEKMDALSIEEQDDYEEDVYFLRTAKGTVIKASKEELKEYDNKPVKLLANEMASLIDEYDFEKKESLFAIFKAIEEVMDGDLS